MTNTESERVEALDAALDHWQPRAERAEAQRDRVREALSDLLAAIGGVSYDGAVDCVEEVDEARRLGEEVLRRRAHEPTR